MKNPYYPTTLGLHFNYLVRGMGVILMSLNMTSLETLRQTNAAGVSTVISSLGIGQLSVLLFTGLLPDRFGRRPFIMLGMYCYMAFFSGILHTNNIIIAYIFGFLARMANGFLDAGTYPSLMEAFPRLPGTVNILVKAFVSSGQFLLPLVISLLVWAELWFDWSFMIAAGIMFISALFSCHYTFPPHPGHHLTVIKKTTNSTGHRCPIIGPASYSLYGYVSTAAFYLVSQWLAQYRQFVADMSCTISVKLLSIHTAGSPLYVFITTPLIHNTVRPTTLLMLYTLISFITLFIICLHPTFYIMIIFAFVIGFTSAGGVVQIGLTLMVERFPYTKGEATGIYCSADSVATSTIPLVTAHPSRRSIADIMWSDIVIAAIGFILALFISLRSRKETWHHTLEENIVPGG